MKKIENQNELNRRDFLRGSSIATLMMMMGGVEIRAQQAPAAEEAATEYKPLTVPVNCALIGCGRWGREILDTLARIPQAPVVAICDTYDPYLRRAARSAPDAQKHDDYHKLLEQKDVQAVIVATPTHLHKDIVFDVLQAGKHVYCEAPLAGNIEDARAITQAAMKATKLYFQPGLQMRADAYYYHLLTFIRAGLMGRNVQIRSQWHKKQSWRFASPSPEREIEINWRLSQETSTGLIGEIGIHQIDLVNWFLMTRPVSVTGFGAIQHWKDGRDVHDTIQTVLQYPNNVNMIYDSTLASSFDSDYDMFYGSDSTIMTRDRHAWMFKEVDSPMIGWEVYAKKEQFYKENGVVLDADATKLARQGAKGASKEEATQEEKSTLQHALEAFVGNSYTIQSAVEDFFTSYGKDAKGIKQHLSTLKDSMRRAASCQDGLDATIIAIKANEAVVKGQKVAIQEEPFKLA